MGKITALVNHLYQFDFKNRHIVSPLSRTCGMERGRGVRSLTSVSRVPAYPVWSAGKTRCARSALFLSPHSLLS